MATMKCEFCGKTVQYGESGTHKRGVAGGRWLHRATRTRKVFKPNLHYRKIEVDGVMVRARLCTKCVRKLRPVWNENTVSA